MVGAGIDAERRSDGEAGMRIESRLESRSHSPIFQIADCEILRLSVSSYLNLKSAMFEAPFQRENRRQRD